MCVILIAIGMHTKPCTCIGSLAFTTCNWELLCNTDLIFLYKKVYSARNMANGAIK